MLDISSKISLEWSRNGASYEIATAIFGSNVEFARWSRDTLYNDDFNKMDKNKNNDNDNSRQFAMCALKVVSIARLTFLASGIRRKKT